MGRALRRTLLGGALVLAAAIAAPFLVPLSHFIPGLERAASSSFGHPVRVADLQLYLLPSPRLLASGVTLGRRAEVRIGELEIVPDLLSFLSGPGKLRLIRAARVEVQESVLRAGHALSGRKGGESIGVERVLLEDVVLHHAVLRPPRFDLEAAMRTCQRRSGRSSSHAFTFRRTAAWCCRPTRSSEQSSRPTSSLLTSALNAPLFDVVLSTASLPPRKVDWRS